MESQPRPRPRLPGISLHLWLGLLISALAACAGHAAPVPSSVLVWGQEQNGPITPPAVTDGHTIAIAAADQTLMALLDDGSVVCWGNNSYGQTNVPASASHDIIAISAGYRHCLALTSGGQVIAWGDTALGQSSVPDAAQSGVIQISAGHSHSLALKNDGSVIAWGSNSAGQSQPPAEARSGITSISAGRMHSLAITKSGAVIAWGDSSWKQSEVPPSAQSGIAAVAGGGYHSVALKGDGTIVVWGDFGGLPTPEGHFSAIAAGTYSFMAIRHDATLFSYSFSVTGGPQLPATYPKEFQAIAAGAAVHLGLKRLAPTFKEIPSSQPALAGSPLTLKTTVAVGGGGTTVQWQKDGTNLPGATNLSLTFPSLNFSDTGSYTIIASNFWGAVTSTPPAIITVVPEFPPVLVRAPASADLLLDSDPPTLSVAATGEHLTYQWRKNGADIPGANDPTLNLGAPDFGLAGQYAVVIQNGGGSITSAPPAVIRVYADFPPLITQGPASLQVLEGDSPISLSVTATGGSLKFQWQKDGKDIPGATVSTLNLGTPDPSMSGRYTVIVRNGGGSVTSAPPAFVTVTPYPVPVIVSSPQSVTGYEGLSTTLSVKASGDSLTYQWRKDGVNLPGATTPQLLLPQLTVNDSGSYTVVVSNQRKSVTNDPPAYLLVLHSLPPTIVTQPRDTTVTAGSTLKLTVQAAGLPLQYQWFKDGVAIPGATNANLLRIRSSPQNAGDYTVVVSTPKGSDTSAPPARVIVTPAPVLPVLTGGVFDPTDELPVPAEAQKGVVAISGDNGLLPSNDYQERLALLQDGSVMAWGGKQLRVDVSQHVPVRKSTHAGKTKLPGAVSGIFASVGDVFLMTSGAIVGASPTAPGVSLIPTSDDTAYVALEGNNPKQSSSTRDHLVALRNNGTVVELNGSFEPPVTARSGVLAIAAGNTFTVALRTDGAAVAWEFPTGAALPMDPVFGAQIRAIAADTNGFAGIRVDGSMVFQRLDGSALTLPAPSDGVLASGTPTFALTYDNRALTWDGTRWQPADVPNWTQGRILAHSGSLLLLKEGAPIIQRQPSGASLRQGRSLDLSVDGGGPGATYQWFKDGMAIPGATTPNPHFGLANDASAGSYTVVISNAVGSITSAPPAVVTVLPAPLSGFSRAVSSDGSETPLTTVQVERSYDHSLYLYPEGLVASTFDHSLTYTNYLGDAYHDSRDFGQWIVPTAALSGVVEIHADDFGGSLARKADGTIIYWGGGLPYGKALISPSSNIRTIEGGYRTWFITNDGGIVRWDWDRNIFTQDGVPEAARSGVKSLLAGFFGGALKTDGSLIPLGSGAIPADAQSGIVAFAIARGSNFQHHSPVWAKADGSLFAWSNEGFQETIQRFAAKIPNVTQISTTQTFFDAVNQPPNFMVVRTSDGKAYYVKANDPNPKPVQIPPGWEGRIVSFDVDPAATVITAILRDIPRPQSIQFSLPGSIPFGSAATPLTSTSASGLPVRFTVVDGPASIVDGVLQVTGLGTIRIAADQEGNLAYQPAPRVIQSLSVLPGLQITESTRTPGLSVTLPAGQTAVLERGDLSGPWTPVLNLTGLGAETPINVPFAPSDSAATSSFWRVTLDLIRN